MTFLTTLNLPRISNLLPGASRHTACCSAGYLQQYKRFLYDNPEIGQQCANLLGDKLLIVLSSTETRVYSPSVASQASQGYSHNQQPADASQAHPDAF